jgi:ribosomal protein L37AE/L43A
MKPRANTVYVIDTRHFLDEKGAIEPKKGPARKLADFTTAVIAHASDFERSESTPGPVCFKCRKRDDRRVDTGMTDDDAVVWHCPACGTEGRVSNWRGTFWDLSDGLPSN